MSELKRNKTLAVAAVALGGVALIATAATVSGPPAVWPLLAWITMAAGILALDASISLWSFAC